MNIRRFEKIWKPLKKILAPLGVVALGIGVFALLQVSKPEPEKSEKEIRALSVFVEPVQRSDVTLNVHTQGEVRARTEIDLVTQVGGRVVAVSPEFTEGGLVEPGKALVTIEDTDYKLALIQAEVRVAEAEVRVQQALATADVARKQLRGDVGATALALKRPQVAEARARLKAARADLEQASVNLERTKITLPFRGRLVSTQVDVGQYLSPGTRLGKAFSTDIVEVRIPLTDNQLASLGLPIGYAAGDEAGRKVRFSARVAGTQQHWQGRLVRLDSSIDRSTRLIYGLAEVIDPYGVNVSEHQMPMAVGLYVDAVIEGQVVDDAYLIPRQALRAGDNVYVVNKEGLLEIREVGVLHSSSSEAVISRGVAQGEQVVISSIRNPIPGMPLAAMPEKQMAYDPGEDEKVPPATEEKEG